MQEFDSDAHLQFSLIPWEVPASSWNIYFRVNPRCLELRCGNMRGSRQRWGFFTCMAAVRQKDQRAARRRAGDVRRDLTWEFRNRASARIPLSPALLSDSSVSDLMLLLSQQKLVRKHVRCGKKTPPYVLFWGGANVPFLRIFPVCGC